ncbi:hypothetical protein DPMN_110582 [Dreissena polymorpha]|uniref:Uncharacterized protein n=1 Tax=Dreissena polymorpha TaxID=45954 RepID=A0A9D4KCA2_DREPO|nr:hypothetical protein DPMN_110582 [Dreissena polymorpha]
MKSSGHPTSIATETLKRRPQQDDNAAKEDQVNVPSHFFFHTDETPQQDVDTPQLLLILSNDVELNPGPVRYSCLIINNISGQVP